jgi:hypothetical protein
VRMDMFLYQDCLPCRTPKFLKIMVGMLGLKSLPGQCSICVSRPTFLVLSVAVARAAPAKMA